MTDLLEPAPPDERVTQLSQTNERLERELRLRDRFLAVVTHELRAPLTPIVMLSEMLAGDDGLDAPTREAAEQIHGSALLATRLISDLLDLSRLNYGKLQYHMEALDIHELLRHAAATVRFDAGERSITIATEMRASARVVHGDDDRLTQAVLNVLTNAVKFTGDGGRIAIATYDHAEGVIGITVSDTGIGIEQERLEHLFDPFYQAPEERSVRKHGLGLGLPISRMLIEAHGGSIAAQSEGAGRGATFEILLPVLA